MSSVDEIPNGWIQTTIGELVELAQGVAINAKTKHVLSNEDEGIPLLKINNLINDTIDQYANPDLVPEKSIIHKNDVIFTRTGQVGEVFKNKFGILHNNSFKVIPNEKLHWSYLYWYLKDRRVYNYVQKVAAGSVQKDLNHGAFKTIEFKYPKDIEEQKGIANILTAFDDKIENLQAQNKTLEQTAQTIFKVWFGKYQVGDELPDGWRVGKLGDIITLQSGFVHNTKISGIKKSLIAKMGVVNGKDLFYTKSVINYSEVINDKHRLYEDDLIVCTRDVTQDRKIIGNVSITPRDLAEEGIYAGSNTWIIRTEVNRFYLFLFLRSRSFRHHIIQSAKGSTIVMITKDAFLNREIIFPKTDYLNEFIQLITPIFHKIKTNTQQIQTLKKTRDTLLPKLMSGQIRVNEFKN